MSYFATLEASVWRVPSSGSISLGVILVLISLVVVRIPLSMEVVAMIVSLTTIVPLSTGWCPVLVNIYRDWGVIHPSWGIWQIILRCVLSLWVQIVPLWLWLLWSKVLRTLFTFWTNTKNVRHLVGLACMAWTGVSREPDYYDWWRVVLHSDVLIDVPTPLWHTTTRHGWGLETQYYTMTSGLLVRYKATLSRGMSSECSLFVVLQSDPFSLSSLSSTSCLRIRPLSELLSN